MELTQAEADELIKTDKIKAVDDKFTFPPSQLSLVIPLTSADRVEHFVLDISTSKMKIAKLKLQCRARQNVVLVRLDLNGAPHRNPDDVLVVCPHLHVYREGYGDKWATMIDPALFTDPKDHWTTLNEFMAYCSKFCAWRALMIDEINGLIDSHTKWLRDSTSVCQIDKEWLEVTTPYLDRHNDMLQYYVRRDSDGYVLSDGGETISDLVSSGCKLDTKRRQQLLNVTLRGFGVSLDNGELQVKATIHNFNIRKHMLVQAMLAVNDMFYLSVPMVQSLFVEDVSRWLDESDVRYTGNVMLVGKSGFSHHFEFIIPKSRQATERVVEAINNPTKQNAELFAFKWLDTKESRANDSKAYALLNDQDKPIPAGVLDALAIYDINAVQWGNRTQVIEELAA